MLPLAASWYFACPTSAVTPGRDHVAPFCGRVLTVSRDGSGRLSADVPLLEQNGMVLAWFHPDGAAPWFEVPSVAEEGWSPMVFRHVDVRTHPQHVMHDLADLVHFETIHEYGDLQVVAPFSADGPRLSLAMRFGWDSNLPVLRPKLPAAFESRAWGLGVQVTEVVLPTQQVRTRHLVMPTPLDAHTTRVHLGLSVRPIGLLGDVERRVGRPLQRPLRRALREFMMRMYLRDVGRDVAIWTTRRAGGHLDPDSRRYVDWTKQFYGRAPEA